MKQKLKEEKLISYILGDLPEDEQLLLEQEIFAQEDNFEQLQALKEQLIDEYTNNKLTGKQLELFERQFLNSPWRRERIVFAHALVEHINQTNKGVLPAKQETVIEGNQEVKSSFWQSLKNSSLVILLSSIFHFSGSNWQRAVVATMLLLLLVSVSWLFFDNRRLKVQIAQLQQPQTQPEDALLKQRLSKELTRIKQLEEELAQARSQSAITSQSDKNIKKDENNNSFNSTLSFILISKALRSEGGLQKLQIPRLTQQIELVVNFQSQNNTIYAQITTLEGQQIWQSQINTINKNNSKLAKVKLKASLLQENDYILTLTELDDDARPSEKIGEYPFRVLKK